MTAKTTTRRASYEQARQKAIDEVEELRGQPQPRLYVAWDSPEWHAYRDQRARRITSLERQIIGLTTILETIR